VFRGTRMPVATVFENLEAGATIDNVMEWFGVTREQVTAVLDFAARGLETPVRRSMLILFDQGTPALRVPSYRTHGQEHKGPGIGNPQQRRIAQSRRKCWISVLVTTNKNIRYQQNLAERTIAIVVLGHARWPVVRLYVTRVVTAGNAATPGSYLEVEIPSRYKHQVLVLSLSVTENPFVRFGRRFDQ
jgi:Protein of unknown function (DUF433)